MEGSIATEKCRLRHGEPRASEKTHKQTSTFYIYRSHHFQLRMKMGLACHAPPGPMSPRWQLLLTGKMSVHHDHVTARLSARDSAMRPPHQNKTWTPGQGILHPSFLNNVRRAPILTCHPAHPKNLLVCTQNKTVTIIG